MQREQSLLRNQKAEDKVSALTSTTVDTKQEVLLDYLRKLPKVTAGQIC